jgi:hypothetical protein
VSKRNHSQQAKRETGAHVHAPLKIATLFVATFTLAGFLIAYPPSRPALLPVQSPVAGGTPARAEPHFAAATLPSVAAHRAPHGRRGAHSPVHHA